MDVVNRHHLPAQWPQGYVYVGRGTALGNPYQVGVDGDRDECVDQFRDDIAERYLNGDPVLITALAAVRDARALVCSCAPRRCHAEVVADYVQRLRHEGAPRRRASMAYAGIGSRETPPAVLALMTKIARFLGELGYTLRSGAARGADSAFEAGANRREIYLPWRGFEKRASRYSHPSPEAAAIAACIHPAWHRLTPGARALQSRNSHQVLGELLRDPVDFVCCWTPDGASCAEERTPATGGTGQAIALASLWEIPVFNLARPGALAALRQWLADRHGHAVLHSPTFEGTHVVQEPFVSPLFA